MGAATLQTSSSTVTTLQPILSSCFGDHGLVNQLFSRNSSAVKTGSENNLEAFLMETSLWTSHQVTAELVINKEPLRN